MDKLQQLYQKRDTFREFGSDVPEELSSQIRQAEHEVLKRELLPVIAKAATKKIPNLGLDKDVIVAFEYKESKLTSIGISTDVEKMHKFDVVCKVTKMDDSSEQSKDYSSPFIATKDSLPTYSEPVTEPKVEARIAIKKMPAKGLCVFLANGEIIQDRDASSTMTKAIQWAGPMNVAQLNIMLDKLNLVSREKNRNPVSQQHYASDGFYVNTHCNTATKKRLLDRISDLLHLGWKVEIIDK